MRATNLKKNSSLKICEKIELEKFSYYSTLISNARMLTSIFFYSSKRKLREIFFINVLFFQSNINERDFLFFLFFLLLLCCYKYSVLSIHWIFCTEMFLLCKFFHFILWIYIYVRSEINFDQYWKIREMYSCFCLFNFCFVLLKVNTNFQQTKMEDTQIANDKTINNWRGLSMIYFSISNEKFLDDWRVPHDA